MTPENTNDSAARDAGQKVYIEHSEEVSGQFAVSTSEGAWSREFASKEEAKKAVRDSFGPKVRIEFIDLAE